MIRLIIALLFLIPFSVSASDWELYSDDKDVRIYIDNESIRVSDSNVKVWVKWEYAIPQEIKPTKWEEAKTANSSIKYRVEKSLELMNCQKMTMANIKRVFYSDLNGGKSVYSTENGEKIAEYSQSEVVPDTTGEMILKYVCGLKKKN